MTRRGLTLGASEDCLGCGATPHALTTALTYHNSTAFKPHVESGYLCSMCANEIEAILGDGDRDECEWCGAPFPDAVRNQLIEFDQDDVLQNIVTLCNDCLQKR